MICGNRYFVSDSGSEPITGPLNVICTGGTWPPNPAAFVPVLKFDEPSPSPPLLVLDEVDELDAPDLDVPFDEPPLDWTQ